VIARADLAVVADAVAKLGAKYPAVFWKLRRGPDRHAVARELGVFVAAGLGTTAHYIRRMTHLAT
jgi:hypothetical protein